MRSGEIAVMMDEHVGIGEDTSSYLLHPGDSGLVVESDPQHTTLLISGHLVYVLTESLQPLKD